MKREFTIAIIWQRFLPYHLARINRLQALCDRENINLIAIEVASSDESYGFPVVLGENKYECCFPGQIYHTLHKNDIYGKTLELLSKFKPDIVFAPATAFPEGMAAYYYRTKNNKRAVMMDDAWEHTDNRGGITIAIKRLIHKNIDAAFIPAETHYSYYKNLGFSSERVIYGVDVVDNDFYHNRSEAVRMDSDLVRSKIGLPDRYFLFVGRFLPCKGIETLIDAYKEYRRNFEGIPWGLVLVGDGPHLNNIQKRVNDCPGVVFAGAQFGDDLCVFYGLASILVVPSITDTWGLVVNEAMASALPVIVSDGCGAARALVLEDKNGWIFPSENVSYLCDTLLNAASLDRKMLVEFGSTSRRIIADWSLDRFAEGVIAATEISRRSPAGFLSNLALRFWKGRISVN